MSIIPNITISTSSAAVYTPYYTVSTLTHPDKGHLYNWAATVALEDGQSQTTEFPTKRQGICPNGWHVPTTNECWALFSYLEFSISGGKMKTTGTLYWNSPNNGATNSSGFSAFPTGEASGSSVWSLGEYAYFWQSSAYNVSSAMYWRLQWCFTDSGGGAESKSSGKSVRCLRD